MTTDPTTPGSAAPAAYDTVTLLSDYGTADGFVGVVHSVIRQMAPDAGIVDLTHDIAPFDVRGASLVLARSVQYLCPGVIVALVDPEVGTERRSIAIEVAGGRAVLMGPDNGVLAPAVGMIGGADRAVVLDNPEHLLETNSTTFTGRDVFAPAAAALCAGVAFSDLGSAVDPITLLPGVVPLTRLEDGVLAAEVLWIDRFGNVQLNVDPDEIDAWGSHLDVRTGSSRRSARRVTAFGELGASELGLLVDADGLIAIVANRASAATELRLTAGDEVLLRPIDDEDDGGLSSSGNDTVVTRVELGRQR